MQTCQDMAAASTRNKRPRGFTTSVWMDPDLWDRACRRAAAEYISVSAYLRRLLARDLARDPARVEAAAAARVALRRDAARRKDKPCSHS
jgi:hypothetical protein